MSSPIIAIADANLRYSTAAEVIVALDETSLGVAEGELVAVVGASGSGKTSLLNVIGGLQEIDSGTIVVGSHHVHEMSVSERADMRLHDVGVVFQDHNLIPEFDALENVMLPLQARGTAHTEAREQATEWLHKVGLGNLGKRAPAELSGGQRQRVGIARALVGGRRILITDEPTGSLDAKNSLAIFQLLHQLSRDGVTVLIATHDELVNDFADRTVVMLDGKLSPQKTGASV